jgi:hypothetical protein
MTATSSNPFGLLWPPPIRPIYGAARVTEASTVALAADMIDVRRLQRMLEQGLVAPLVAPTTRVIPRARYLRPATQYALP